MRGEDEEQPAKSSAVWEICQSKVSCLVLSFAIEIVDSHSRMIAIAINIMSTWW